MNIKKNEIYATATINSCIHSIEISKVFLTYPFLCAFIIKKVFFLNLVSAVCGVFYNTNECTDFHVWKRILDIFEGII